MKLKISVLTMTMGIFVSFNAFAGVGQKLVCYPHYAVNYKIFPNEAGIIRPLKLVEATEGVQKTPESLFGSFEVDLDRMNSNKDEGAKTQYAYLLPDVERSDNPVDISFSPWYQGAIDAGNLKSIEIHVGHARQATLDRGFMKKRLAGLAASKVRSTSTPYDKRFYNEVSVTMNATLGNEVKIELPTLNAGLRDIEITCYIK